MLFLAHAHACTRTCRHSAVSQRQHLSSSKNTSQGPAGRRSMGRRCRRLRRHGNGGAKDGLDLQRCSLGAI